MGGARVCAWCQAVSRATSVVQSRRSTLLPQKHCRARRASGSAPTSPRTAYMNELLDFLSGYISCLRQVTTAEDAYSILPCWQSANADLWEGLCPRLNAALGLQGLVAFVGHIPTTLVGRLDGWVLVAANPGWNPQANAAENGFRRESEQHNAAFAGGFFGRYPAITGTTNSTWSRVLKMRGRATHVHNIDRLGGKRLWARASEEGWPVGGVDLVPFHSARDGITPLLLNPLNETAQTMRAIALETLLMTLRVNPQMLIVASEAGLGLVEHLASTEQLVEHQVRAYTRAHTGLWFDVKHYAFQPSAGTVLALSRQVFSGNSRIPRGRRLQELLPLLVEQPGA